MAAAIVAVAIPLALAYLLRDRIREEWLLHRLETADQDGRLEILEEISKLERLSPRGMECLTREAREEVRAYTPKSTIHSPPRVLPYAIKAGGATAVRAILASEDEDYLLKALDRLNWGLGENPDAISGILPLLDSGNSVVREAAIDAMGDAGADTEEVVLALTRLLRDPSEDIRREAEDALGGSTFDRQGLLRHFTAISRDPDPEQRRIGIRLLERMVSPGLSQHPAFRSALLCIAAGLDDVAEDVRDEAAQALANMGSHVEPVMLSLIRALERTTSELNYSVIQCLTSIGEPALKPLLTVLRHQNAMARLGGVVALDRMEGGLAGAAVPAFVERLADIEPDVREAACRALGHLGPAARSAEPALREHMGDRFDSVRSEAARALWRVAGDGKAAAVVLETTVLSRNENVFRGSVWTLREIGTAAKAAAPSLRKLLNDETCSHQLWAAEALSAVLSDDDVILERLPKALACPCMECPQEAARICERFGGRAAPIVPGTIGLLKHPSPMVRSYAARALGYIGPAAQAALPALEEASRDSASEVRDAAKTAQKEIRSSTPRDIRNRKRI